MVGKQGRGASLSPPGPSVDRMSAGAGLRAARPARHAGRSAARLAQPPWTRGISDGVIIEAGVVIGEAVFIGAGTRIFADAHVERFCHIGAGVTIEIDAQVGADAIIGAGAVVGRGAVVAQDADVEPCQQVRALASA